MSRRGSPQSAVAGLVALVLAGGIGALAAAPAAANPITLPPASLTDAGNLISPLTNAIDPLSLLSSAARTAADLSLDALGSSVLGAAGAALKETASIIDRTTSPRLESTWFSLVYWRVAALAALLTLPFLFAAAAQSLLRSDLAMLVRAAFAQLPLALIGVSIAAPITMLLLSATDEMCSLVESTGAAGGAHFLKQTAVLISGLSVLAGSPFLAFAIGLLTLLAALALGLEMLIREAAVYVVMLMLPLAFAALVWPARRTWAIRLIELLISLILSKFVIVAVLSLAGAAYGSSGAPSVTRLLTAMALVMLSTLAPWVMLRLLPFTELAAGAAGAIRAELPRSSELPKRAGEAAHSAADWAEALSPRMRRQAAAADPSSGTDDPAESGVLRTRTSDEGSGLSDGASGASGFEDVADPLDPLGDPTAASAASAASAGPPAANGSPGPSSSTAYPEPDSPASPVKERLPGMEPHWQGPNQTWSPVNLGLGGYGGATGLDGAAAGLDAGAVPGGAARPLPGSDAASVDQPPLLPPGDDRPLLEPGDGREPR